MATIKLGSLVVRTLAKPLANSIKAQAKEHPAFREFCINLAQKTHRWEQELQTRFLGYKPKQIRPLNDAKAVENGAAFLSEGFILSVAILTILGETWRSQRKSTNQKRDVDESINQLETDHASTQDEIEELRSAVSSVTRELETLQKQNRQLQDTLDSLVQVVRDQEVGRHGWIHWTLRGWWEPAEAGGPPEGLLGPMAEVPGGRPSHVESKTEASAVQSIEISSSRPPR
ncbi:hypothetical protein HK097_003630 [Rhizophlyctis rosea]|uniref:OPA3-domain-containing protein n=1 Tax=Rhizophlyctis rosea TaxID=64517 RepID=A0AAD5X0H4_9FUNG|nr:hypothetical protein HK097_003630 [Rhizophlyctis rosea]